MHPILSRMSHNIRTPMNAILASDRSCQTRAGAYTTVKSYLDKLEASGRFLMGLLNDVLDISKIERNAIELYPQPYDLLEFKQQVEALIIPQCIQKKIEFVFDEKELQYKTVMLDKLRFNQIVFNLLNNAVRYTPYGGRIELRMRELERVDGRLHTQMMIRDNGIGMSREFQEHMYEPFSREGREAGNYDGRSSGLGLAIVKSLVELMGEVFGLTASRRRGRNSTWTFGWIWRQKLTAPKFRKRLRLLLKGFTFCSVRTMN